MARTGRAGRRDQAADGLADLVQCHGAMAYRLAAAIVRDHALAEDVVQEVLFKAWRAGENSDEQVPEAWIRVVTRNTAIDMLRRRRFMDVTDRVPESAGMESSTERTVEGRYRLEAVWDSLGNIDAEGRTMLVLREAEGLSYDEIAQLLDTTPSAVKAKLYRSRHMLRTSLDQWDR